MALPTGKCSENGLAVEEDERDRLVRASALVFYEIIYSSNDVSILCDCKLYKIQLQKSDGWYL